MPLSRRRSKLDILKRRIPRNYNLIQFSELGNDISPNAAIMGRMVKRSRMNSNAHHSWIRAELVEVNGSQESGDKTLVACFFATVVPSALALNVGDYVALAGFMVKKREGEQRGPSYPYMLSLAKPQCHIWTTKAKQRSYAYLPLNQILIASNSTERYNCYAVVSRIEIVAGSGGRLSRMELYVSDPTHQILDVVVYQEAEDDHFPSELVPGCVIRFHRLKVVCRDGVFLGQVRTPKDCLVFTRDNLTPVSTARTFTLTDQDHVEAEKLKTWFQRIHSSPKEFKDLKGGEFASVLCQIVKITMVRSGQCAVLSVWDGTQLPFQSLLPVEARYEWEKRSDILEEFAHGYVYDVWVYDEHTLVLENLLPQDIIVLHNLHLHYKQCYSRYHLYMHGGSGFNRCIQPLPQTSPQAMDISQRLNAFVLYEEIRFMADQDEEPRNEEPAQLTPPEPSPSPRYGSVIVHPSVDVPAPLVSQRTCSHTPESGTELPFYRHQTVRVLSVLALTPEDVVWWHCSDCHYLVNYATYSGEGQCPNCDDSLLSLKMMLILDLAAGEDLYQAVLWGIHCETFFRGIRPIKVLDNPSIFQEMLQRLTAHCPRLECCLYFYTSAISQTRRVQIRNTVIAHL